MDFQKRIQEVGGFLVHLPAAAATAGPGRLLVFAVLDGWMSISTFSLLESDFGGSWVCAY